MLTLCSKIKKKNEHAIGNVKSRKTGNEVIADHQPEKNKVVEHTFQAVVKLERGLQR